MKVKIIVESAAYHVKGRETAQAKKGDVIEVTERTGKLLLQGKQAAKVRETTARKPKLETS